jgi:EAL domain-containing protein (putative c-di-GMP-specific phosphodiesterase class I)
MDVIVEGVKTEEQRQFFYNNKLHSLSGFLFGKPLKIEQFKALLKQG